MSYPAPFAVVIPAYNEAATIRDVAQRALQHCPLVIVVNDGSSDDTAGQLTGLDVVLLNNNGNQGKAASLWRGLQHAVEQGAQAAITLDGDGQHDPRDIPDLLNEARLEYKSLIIAARLLNRDNAPKARLFANNFADFWVSWACGQFVQDSQSGFRLYPAQLIKDVRVPVRRERSFVFESEVAIEAARLGYSITAVPIESRYHANARPSHFRPGTDITRIVLMIAWKLISRGLYAQGLYRSLTQRARYQKIKKAGEEHA